MPETIELLDQTLESVAAQIFSVLQRAYRHEADLLGVQDFPPLRTSVQAIQAAESTFLGCRKRDELAGVIEVTTASTILHIDSLAVRPALFGGGIATGLVTHVLNNMRWDSVEVCTAVENHPALSLYEKLGFVRQKTWTSKEGIALTSLALREKKAGAKYRAPA